MQPARIKPHAKEHTNNPVQRPNFRGHAGTMARTRVHKPRQSSRTTRGERTRELVSTWLLPPFSLISASTRLSFQLHLVLEVARLFQPSPLSPWQVPGQARARMQHKHKQARHEQAHSVM